MDGTAAVGSSMLFSRQDHVHPSNTANVAKAGDTMTGPLTLPGPPSATLQAATKGYVDGAVPAPATVAPPVDGTAAVGTSLLYARQDHVHPSDTSRVAKTGDTMTGDLGISKATPTLSLTKPASGSSINILGYTGTTVRWQIKLGDGTVESGGNSGSNFAISRFTDAGGSIDIPLSIDRSSGIAAFASTPTAPVSAADYLTNATPGKVLTTGTVWAAAARSVLSDSSGTINIDFNTAFDFWINLTGTGRTIAAPTNFKQGQKGVIAIQQDATGNRTITSWPASFKFPGGTKPVLSTGANAVDIISYWVGDSSPFIACSFQANFF